MTFLLAAALAYSITVPWVKTPPALRADAADSAWKSAAHVRLEHDLTFRHDDQGQTTDVYIVADSQFVYVRFVCAQTVPIVAEQHTNNSGIESDDYVTLKLWPGGRSGIIYSFSATPNGTHDQSSSENTAFAPAWDSVGGTVRNGFIVMMRVPRRVMRGDGRVDWPIQFARVVQKKSLRLVWSYDAAMTYAGDSLYAGTANGVGTPKATAGKKAQARFQPYLLAQTDAPRVGDSSSRAGLDFSIPVGDSTSLYGTFHPDYSEVERDQQFIAPSEFHYRYNEVRPFFTQGANYFNAGGSQDLYTPSIPTPRYGYAIEGTRSRFQYAAFNAVGLAGRDDNAESVAWGTEDHRYSVGAQRVAVAYPGFSDTVTSYSASVGNGKHFAVFGNYGVDSGTNVLDAAQNRSSSIGANLYGPNESVFIQRSDIGLYYAPADGYVTYTDAHGYSGNIYRQFNFSKSSLQKVTFSFYADRYTNRSSAVNQVDSSLYLGLTNRHQSGINFNLNNSYGLSPKYGIVPYNQSGIYLYDSANTGRTFAMGIFGGRFYDGFLRYYSGNFNIKLRPQESIAASEDRFVNTSSSVGRAVERLDSVSFSYQYSKLGSFAAGVRWISGQPAYFTRQPSVSANNITFSIDQRLAHTHFYIVYGNPNARSTVPSIIFKLVRFLGADEGT